MDGNILEKSLNVVDQSSYEPCMYFFLFNLFNLFHSGYTTVGSASDCRSRNREFHQVTHSLLRLKQSSKTEIPLNLDISTRDPSTHKMTYPILIVSIC